MGNQPYRKVLISFQGDDIGKDFADSLFKALSDRGFHTKLSSKIFQPTWKDVKESRVVIVIFPENFTEEKIDLNFHNFFISKLESHDPQFLYPIFYNTNPSHVKITADKIELEEEYDDEYFRDMNDNFEGWRDIMHQVADLPGWHFKHGDGNEFEFIDKIVEDVSRTFDGVPPLHTAILDQVPTIPQNPQSVPNVSLTAVDKVLMAISQNAKHVHDQVSLVFQDTKTRTWRVVGLISGFAGLLCYALSPSFKPLIRGWKPFSIIVYVVLCLVILAIILFAKQASPSTRQSRNHLTSELKKAFTTFAAVIIISVYSVFYDKAVNGKPHILSVISNVVFAMVSLSLRKLTNSGFEFGVFCYFFGCFTIQLLLINRLLIFVAIIIGFLLFYMRSPLFSKPVAEGVESSSEHNV